MSAEKQKKILLLLTNRFAAINVFHSGLIGFLARRGEITVWSDFLDSRSFHKIKKDFGVGLKFVDLPFPRPGPAMLLLKWIQKILFFHAFRIRTYQLKRQRKPLLLRLGETVPAALARVTGGEKTGLRKIRALLQKRMRARHFPEQLRNAGFDALISTSPMDIRENLVTTKLGNYGVKALGTIISWDNLTTKGVINADFEKVLVWNELMAAEYRNFYSLYQVPLPGIGICGVPRFDIHSKSLPARFSKAAFLRKFDLQVTDRILLFATGAPVHFPNQADIARHLLEYVHGRPGLKVLVRGHPYDLPERYRQLSDDTRIRFWFPDEKRGPRRRRAACLPHADMLLELAAMLRYCELCVNIASTIRLEAFAAGTPVISIAYDGNRRKPAKDSVKRLYGYSHQTAMEPFMEDDRVYSKQALFEALDSLLIRCRRPRPQTPLSCFGVTPGHSVPVTMKYINEWLD